MIRISEKFGRWKWIPVVQGIVGVLPLVAFQFIPVNYYDDGIELKRFGWPFWYDRQFHVVFPGVPELIWVSEWNGIRTTYAIADLVIALLLFVAAMYTTNVVFRKNRISLANLILVQAAFCLSTFAAGNFWRFINTFDGGHAPESALAFTQTHNILLVVYSTLVAFCVLNLLMWFIVSVTLPIQRRIKLYLRPVPQPVSRPVAAGHDDQQLDIT